MSLNKFTIQKSFAISAGAGSGKTYTLSRRYINSLLGFDYFREDYSTQNSYFETLKPARVNEIVTITYTEAAALEMKGRIFELIAKIINTDLPKDDGDYNSIVEANENISQAQKEYLQKNLTNAYTESSNAKISTIHSFCLNIIKANADLARIDTRLDIIKDDEKSKELSTIVFEVLNAEENRELVLDISSEISMLFIEKLIEKYVSSSKFRKDYDHFSRESISVDEYKELIHEIYPLPDIAEALLELQDDTVRLKWFEVFYDNFINFNAVSWNEVDSESNVPSMGPTKFPISDAIKKELDSKSLRIVYSKINRSKENLFFEKIEKIKEILHKIKNCYDNRLIELGKIDFDTIITKTLEIIPEVKTNYKYIMVDEFQDTNATQFEIVKNSCNVDTNLFVVGDSKQSIYSFQGAEIEVFNDAVEDTSIFSSVEPMQQNFRSDAKVLDTVNKIFTKLLKPNDNLKLIKQNYEATAQDLYTSKEGGSFKYLITSQEYQTKEEKELTEEYNELDTIAQFISEICQDKQSNYTHISKLIQLKEKALAIVFDSSTKMLELKQKLREKGISVKVSASDNFYHTKEINDIFNTLKAIDILTKEPEKLSNKEKYYVVGAMRSNILRCDDKTINRYLEENRVSAKLNHYVEVLQEKTLSQAVKYIYDDSNILGVYVHFDDVEQRTVNLNKFLLLCQDYEASDESSLYKFLSLIENAIYFSQEKEDEAFFKSENTKSIEICSIHSTKGLAYPLVILAHSDKGLYTQITSDALKHNNLTVDGERKEIVGFKIGSYTPLSHRVLKEVDKLKHLAEKKRLLYVALTRAEHDIVISAQLKAKKDGGVSLQKDSYLHMICDSLEISIEELYAQESDYCISLDNSFKADIQKHKVEYVTHSLKPIVFEHQVLVSATSDSSVRSDSNSAAMLGTATHKIIEFYWHSFSQNQEIILDKMMIHDSSQRETIVTHMGNFYKSNIYKLLSDGVEHHFELEFITEDETGFIDFIYYDVEKNGWVIIDFKTGTETEDKKINYQKQLDFYTDLMETLDYKIVDSMLLWL